MKTNGFTNDKNVEPEKVITARRRAQDRVRRLPSGGGLRHHTLSCFYFCYRFGHTSVNNLQKN